MEDQRSGSKRMSFLDHLDELRRRLLVCIIAVLVGGAVCWFFAYQILDILTRPVGGLELHYLGIMEPFMAKFKIAVFAGICLAFPIIIYQLLIFVAPALKRKEKKYVYLLLFFLVVLFTGGLSVCYFYVLPLGAQWLLGQAEGKLTQTLTVSQYISFAALFLLAFGVAFETPLVVWTLIKLGVVSPQSLRKNWRIAYIIILIIAAVATPDWSIPPMVILGGSMILLYELSILLARIL